MDTTKDWRGLGRAAYEEYLDIESAVAALVDDSTIQEDRADFILGYEEAGAIDGGGDFLTLDLRHFAEVFASASDIQREYGLSESTVRKACQEKRLRAWQLGRDWIVYRPDAKLRWGKTQA